MPIRIDDGRQVDCCELTVLSAIRSPRLTSGHLDRLARLTDGWSRRRRFIKLTTEQPCADDEQQRRRKGQCPLRRDNSTPEPLISRWSCQRRRSALQPCRSEERRVGKECRTRG